MIGRLRGKIAEMDAAAVLVDVGGVGYSVLCPVSTLQEIKVGKDAELIVHTEMRDSELRLYGFTTKLEKQLFEFLLQVTGVGPKSALEILSSMEAAELIRVLGSGDSARIQKAKGIGKKTAERIVLELKDKVSKYAVESSSLREHVEIVKEVDVTEDSILALVSLGFSKGEAESAVGKALSGNKKLIEAGDVVKAALSFL